MDEAVAAGQTPGEALEAVLRGRAPLVVYREAQGERADDRGTFLGQSLGFVARLAVREVLRDAVLSLLDSVDPGDLIGEAAPE